jgi:ketosteroid isomerase-like protein
MTDMAQTIARLQHDYAAAVLAKDVHAFIRLYDPGVRIFDAWDRWAYEGATPWQRAVEGWFGSLGDERVRVVFDDTRCDGAAGFAMASAVVCCAALSADGGRALIVHEHSSAPIRFPDMKAELQRSAGG